MKYDEKEQMELFEIIPDSDADMDENPGERELQSSLPETVQPIEDVGDIGICAKDADAALGYLNPDGLTADLQCDKSLSCLPRADTGEKDSQSNYDIPESTRTSANLTNSDNMTSLPAIPENPNQEPLPQSDPQKISTEPAEAAVVKTAPEESCIDNCEVAG